MAKETIKIPYKKPLPSEDNNTVLAGIETVDITPPPGMPAAGYAIAACQCYGVRTKLKARIFYLKPKKGKPITLVQCELLSGSLLLHHQIANLIAEKTDVDSAGLSLCATHTHSGPGNYFGSEMYNSNASNKPGLEKNYLNFCSRQIAHGIIRAYQNKKPAKIATGSTEIWNATINRSLEPYLQNDNIRNLRKKPDALQAINPYLHMIRIDCPDENNEYKPAGLFTNFSMHPNSPPRELGGLFNGDVTGFFSRKVEKGIKEKYHTTNIPVHGAANYAHGDCNTNHDQSRPENFKDMQKIASNMAEKTLELFYSLDDKLENDTVIRYRAREINLLEEREANGIKISERGYAGMALPSGARGRGRTTFFDKIPVLFQPGRPKKNYSPDNLQGAKKIIGGPFQKFVLPKEAVPHLFLAQVVQVHDTVLIPLPWEVTQEMGRRIGEKCREISEKAGLTDVKRFVVTDVSNGYFGYINTPEEYSIQYYEGGSNLYGPNTGPYIGIKVGQLAKEMVENDSDGELRENYEVKLTTKTYYPPDMEEGGTRRTAEKPTYFPAHNLDEPYWSFKWYDVPAAKIDFHKPLLEIEVSSDGENWETHYDGALPVNDDGPYLATIYHRKISKDKMGLYEARWSNPPQNNRYYRFKIYPRGNQSLFYSPTMSMKNKD